MTDHRRAKLHGSSATSSWRGSSGDARRGRQRPASACRRRRPTSWWYRWRAAGEQERASLACLEDRSCRPARSPGCSARASRAASARARSATGWGPRLIASEVGHPALDRAPRAAGGAGCRVGPGRRAEAVAALRVALPGQPAAHGHQALSSASSGPATPSPATARVTGARSGRAAATSSPTRSSTTARGWPTRSCTPTSARRPYGLHRAGARLARSSDGIVCEAAS